MLLLLEFGQMLPDPAHQMQRFLFSAEDATACVFDGDGEFEPILRRVPEVTVAIAVKTRHLIVSHQLCDLHDSSPLQAPFFIMLASARCARVLWSSKQPLVLVMGMLRIPSLLVVFGQLFVRELPLSFSKDAQASSCWLPRSEPRPKDASEASACQHIKKHGADGN